MNDCSTGCGKLADVSTEYHEEMCHGCYIDMLELIIERKDRELAERAEACAKVCEGRVTGFKSDLHEAYDNGARDCAEHIRAKFCDELRASSGSTGVARDSYGYLIVLPLYLRASDAQAYGVTKPLAQPGAGSTGGAPTPVEGWICRGGFYHGKTIERCMECGELQEDARHRIEVAGRSPAEVPPNEILELCNLVLGGFNEDGDYNGDTKYIFALCAAVWRSAQPCPMGPRYV